MIIVADSGSTKTDWLLTNGVRPLRYQGAGINPNLLSIGQIEKHIDTAFDSSRMDCPEAIFFYGAGCGTEASKEKVRVALRQRFRDASSLHVESDLLASARALFGVSPGIACILGTGSNSGAYDGRSITQKVLSMGYVLGDEGSGAVLGKKLISLYLRGELPDQVKNALDQGTPVSYEYVLERVYGQDMPNRYLAGFVKNISALSSQDTFLHNLLCAHFDEFFRACVLKYSRDLPLGIVGSVGHHFRKIIEHVASGHGVRIHTILQNPMDRLAEFHVGQVV